MSTLVVTMNVTFGTGDDWQTSYGEVFAVKDNTIGERLFKGKLSECDVFIEKNGFTGTSTPTIQRMPIERFHVPRKAWRRVA